MPNPRLPRLRVSKRSAAPAKIVIGPRVGAVVENGAVVVRVLEQGEHAPGRLQAPAVDNSAAAVKAALSMIAKRVRASLLKPLEVVIQA